jgi:predicted nucleotidyltransferase
MFTPDERDRLRSDLIEFARHDPRISSIAITGSAASGREDRWSDIDLAFGISEEAGLDGVLSDWTAHMYEQCLALHHVDVNFGRWLYRVFLLPGTLQVDLAFAPAAEFGALTPAFRLVYGRAGVPPVVAPALPDHFIGMSWLYALHARTSIARRRWWQAEYMVSGLRDCVLALACQRHGLSAVHGRGIDQLPSEILVPLEGTLVRSLDADCLLQALRAALEVFIQEIQAQDPRLASRLGPSLKHLSDPPE